MGKGKACDVLDTLVLIPIPSTPILLPTNPAGDKELDKDNASVAVVGKDHPLQIIEGEALQKYLDAVELEGNAHEPEAMEVASEGEGMSTS